MSIGQVTLVGGNRLNLLGTPIGQDFEVIKTGTPDVGVLFGRDQPFAGEPVIPTLRGLNAMVEDLVDKFESVYLNSR